MLASFLLSTVGAPTATGSFARSLELEQSVGQLALDAAASESCADWSGTWVSKPYNGYKVVVPGAEVTQFKDVTMTLELTQKGCLVQGTSSFESKMASGSFSIAGIIEKADNTHATLLEIPKSAGPSAITSTLKIKKAGDKLELSHLGRSGDGSFFNMLDTTLRLKGSYPSDECPEVCQTCEQDWSKGSAGVNSKGVCQFLCSTKTNLCYHGKKEGTAAEREPYVDCTKCAYTVPEKDTCAFCTYNPDSTGEGKWKDPWNSYKITPGVRKGGMTTGSPLDKHGVCRYFASQDGWCGIGGSFLPGAEWGGTDCREACPGGGFPPDEITAAEQAKIESILTYWFGELDGTGMPADVAAQNKIWFGGGEELDKYIRDTYGADVEKAQANQYNHWAKTDAGLMALTILVDQFSRNIFRKSPTCDQTCAAKSFAGDALSRANSMEAVVFTDRYKRMPPIYRVFLFLPLEHSEDAGIQAHSVEKFTELAESMAWNMTGLKAGGAWGATSGDSRIEGYKFWAEVHKDTIDNNPEGRFPGRNWALNRANTPWEDQYLNHCTNKPNQAKGVWKNTCGFP